MPQEAVYLPAASLPHAWDGEEAIYAHAGIFNTYIRCERSCRPLIRLMAWPPSNLEQGSSVRGFVYDLVLLLWPAQPLATIEASVGTSVAVAFSVAANILLFAVAGMVAAVSAGQPLRLLTVYIVVCGMVLMVALWGAGFSLEYLNIPALSVAFILYALPFWIVFRFRRD